MRIVYRPDRLSRRESGQTLVEFALLITAFIPLTLGALQVGRAFLDETNLSAAARAASRWGSIVGGACSVGSVSTSDWCIPSGATTFWSQSGNAPLQGKNVTCPSYSTSGANPYYYQVSAYSVSSTPVATNQQTIVGILAQRLDSNGTSPSLLNGTITPAMNLGKLYACIQLFTKDSTVVNGGDIVTVRVHYAADQSVMSLLGSSVVPLDASSGDVLQ